MHNCINFWNIFICKIMFNILTVLCLEANRQKEIDILCEYTNQL